MRKHLPLLLTVCAGAGLAAYGPIAQLANYHEFADQRILFGVPHAGEVLSNLGFAIVGLWGLGRLSMAHGNAGSTRGRYGYGLFLFSLVLTSVGSSFYHLAPDNGRLVWDRLPIALACAGLLAAVRAESRPDVNDRAGTALLAIAAVSSVVWWHVTQRAGQEDLRPYLLLQVLPLVLIPLWQALYGAPRDERITFGAAILLYIAAKVAELNDHALYAVLGVLSGHTVKHLLATMAAALVVGQLGRKAPQQRPLVSRSPLEPAGDGLYLPTIGGAHGLAQDTTQQGVR